MQILYKLLGKAQFLMMDVISIGLSYSCLETSLQYFFKVASPHYLGLKDHIAHDVAYHFVFVC